MIYRAPFFLPWLYPTLVWRIPTEKKELYLTFDDGPVPGPTDFVLETLAQHSIKATFFCIGDNVNKHPGEFNKIIEHGHSIGNHTFNHLKGWSTPFVDYIENVVKCSHQFMDSGLKQPAKLFRPPYGRITRSQIKALRFCKIVMWDVLTHDYNQSISPQACLENSIRVTRPGSVVVFHDSLKAERNMTHVLPRYIEHFVKQGYSFNILRNE